MTADITEDPLMDLRIGHPKAGSCHDIWNHSLVKQEAVIKAITGTQTVRLSLSPLSCLAEIKS